MSAFWIKIKDTNGVTTLGEIRSATSWESEDPLNKAGKFKFSMPAVDPYAYIVQSKRRAHCYTILDDQVVEIGAGIIDKITINVVSGAPVLDIEGDNILRELTYRQVGSLIIDDGAGGSTTDGPDMILTAAGSIWSLDTGNGYGSTQKSIMHQFAGETALAALIRLAELTGENFRVGSDRTIIWMQDDQPNSNIKAIQYADPIAIENNPSVCLITDLQKSDDSYDLVTRVYPYGAGDGAARVTLNGSTWSPPSGWSIDTTNNYIQNDDADTIYDQIDRSMSWKDITSPDMLSEAAYEWLNKQSAPFASYTLSVTALTDTLTPGETIKVIYNRWIDDYHAIHIDADLLITKVVNRMDNRGFQTVGLEVATSSRVPETDVSAITSNLQQMQVISTHEQSASFIPLASPLTSTAWDGDSKTTGDRGTIDLSAVFGAPDGMKAALVRLEHTDGTVGAYCCLGPSSGYAACNVTVTQVANTAVTSTAIVPCDENGDMYFYNSETINNVKIEIWGYWL